MSDKVADAPILVDFDWKLKYAVASDALANVNKPLLRLELSLSAEKEELRNKPQVIVAEYTKSQLDTLISQIEAISKELQRGADESSL